MSFPRPIASSSSEIRDKFCQLLDTGTGEWRGSRWFFVDKNERTPLSRIWAEHDDLGVVKKPSKGSEKTWKLFFFSCPVTLIPMLQIIIFLFSSANRSAQKGRSRRFYPHNSLISDLRFCLFFIVLLSPISYFLFSVSKCPFLQNGVSSLPEGVPRPNRISQHSRYSCEGFTFWTDQLTLEPEP